MPLLDGGEEPLEVIIVFAPLDLDAERSRDLLQELDAEAASMSVVGVDGEWGGVHGSYHESTRWLTGVGLAEQ
jgi:hypothetical protein